MPEELIGFLWFLAMLVIGFLLGPILVALAITRQNKE